MNEYDWQQDEQRAEEARREDAMAAMKVVTFLIICGIGAIAMIGLLIWLW